MSNISAFATENQEVDIDLYMKEVGLKGKWKIGAKKYKCKKGVGFRCGGSGSIYTKIEVKGASSSAIQTNNTGGILNGRNMDRFYSCIIQERNGEIHFEFLEPVDWVWLEVTETN